MDILKALRELYQEKKRLDAAIASLELRLKTGKTGSTKSAKSRRGRKSMGAAERLEVSKRMTLYWETRRTAGNGNASTSQTSSPSDEQLSDKSIAS